MRTRLSEYVSNITWAKGKITCFNRDDWQVGEVVSVAVDGTDLVIGLRVMTKGPLPVPGNRVRMLTGSYQVRMPMESIWLVIDVHHGFGNNAAFRVISFFTREHCEEDGVTPRWQLVLAA